MPFLEENYENAIIELLSDGLGYRHVFGPDIDRDYLQPLYMKELELALPRINPNLPEAAIQEAIYKIQHGHEGGLAQRNKSFMQMLQHGVTVSFFDRGKQQNDLVHLIDYEHTDNNSFVVANQWTVTENSTKRPDVVVFINGLPLVVFEFKSPSREETDASEAYRQIRNYMHEIPSLFVYNAFCVLSDQSTTKAGTITSGEDRFMEWKTIDGNYESTQYAEFEVFFEGIFEKGRILDIIRNFICFSGDAKIMAAYHQYFAVKKAITSVTSAAESDGRGGVFWHTQGSGKSLSMVFFAQSIQHVLNLPTIVVITDRNDLDDQLYSQFSKCADFLRQTPIQAENRSHLRELLENRTASGIIFTTMQKFEKLEETTGSLSERRNIIVMTDEAHRGHYGLEEHVNPKTGKMTYGTARIIRDSLPGATYIGFTGTPISSRDRSTIEIFGNYIDIYDMTQAVEDGATRPVYYESRAIHLKLDTEILREIDTEYVVMAEEASAYDIEKSKQQLGRMDSVLGAEQTLQALCEDIVNHYEEYRQHELEGKAMVVAYSRSVAMRIYRKFLELRPEWVEKLAVVMTSSNNDPEDWHEVIGNKQHKAELARRFKDPNDSLKIAIVVDMWLTGFDVPSLSTMYLYKPMEGHNLMQAIARVNRVYKDKEGGLVVDYVGIASALKQAMRDYTRRDRKNYGDPDIRNTALPKFIEKLEVCRDLFYGYDYSEFLTTQSDLVRARTISGGVNFITAVTPNPIQLCGGIQIGGGFVDMLDDAGSSKTDLFVRESLLLRQALTLCRSLLSEEQRIEAAYFEAVRTVLMRLKTPGKPLSLKEINERVNNLLKASIKSEGVINLFSDAEEGFSLFDPEFLSEIGQMKEKNLAVEMLRKLLIDEVKVYKRNNLVKAQKFSELLTETMNAYINGLITNEQVIDELIQMAKDINNSKAEGQAMGLTEEELAFYDALTSPEAVKDFYENEELIALTRELTEKLRKNRTIDWQKKTSAQARMRRLVKKLLKKYKYPPEGFDDAISTVIGQCELWVEAM